MDVSERVEQLIAEMTRPEKAQVLQWLARLYSIENFLLPSFEELRRLGMMS